MLVLKVQSVCVAMEAVGEGPAVALEVGQVTPTQLGNMCLRQYLSNRSLGKTSSSPKIKSVYLSFFFLSLYFLMQRCILDECSGKSFSGKMIFKAALFM